MFCQHAGFLDFHDVTNAATSVLLSSALQRARRSAKLSLRDSYATVSAAKTLPGRGVVAILAKSTKVRFHQIFCCP